MTVQDEIFSDIAAALKGNIQTWQRPSPVPISTTTVIQLLKDKQKNNFFPLSLLFLSAQISRIV